MVIGKNNIFSWTISPFFTHGMYGICKIYLTANCGKLLEVDIISESQPIAAFSFITIFWYTQESVWFAPLPAWSLQTCFRFKSSFLNKTSITSLSRIKCCGMPAYDCFYKKLTWLWRPILMYSRIMSYITSHVNENEQPILFREIKAK